MFRAELERYYMDSQVVGYLNFYRDNDTDSLLFIKTLELPWRNNEYRKSCIPEGNYHVIPRWSGKFGQHYHILHVPDRTFILFHVANYISQLAGCIAVGLDHMDINNDGLIDVANSRRALNEMHKLLKGEGFLLTIKDGRHGK